MVQRGRHRGLSRGAADHSRRQACYLPLAILTALTLKAVFRLALRQTEGLIGSIIDLLGLSLGAYLLHAQPASCDSGGATTPCQQWR